MAIVSLSIVADSRKWNIHSLTTKVKKQKFRKNSIKWEKLKIVRGEEVNRSGPERDLKK